MPNFINLSGMRFGRLVVIERDRTFGKSVAWICKCDCGNIHTTRPYDLKSGKVSSCGCYQSESRTKHGGSYLPEYYVWAGMKDRCTNKNNKYFSYYGGRGIKVCEQWNDFKNFFADMGPRPGNKYSIDRIDENKDYEPGNCRWATKTEQSRHFRTFKTNALGITGITKRQNGTYVAKITVEGKTLNLGTYSDINDAINARKQGEIKYWGLK